MDTLVAFGSEIKTLEETPDSWRIGGFLVVFGSHDASHLKDRFSPETDFDIEDGDRTSIYYNHGLDGTIKRSKLGDGRLFITDAGVWFEGELKKRTDYLKEHIEKIAEGMSKKIEMKGAMFPAFGLSSGAPAHLVERVVVEGGHLVTKWPLRTDCSITPTPAEPFTSVGAIKSLNEWVSDEEAQVQRLVREWVEIELGL